MGAAPASASSQPRNLFDHVLEQPVHLLDGGVVRQRVGALGFHHSIIRRGVQLSGDNDDTLRKTTKKLPESKFSPGLLFLGLFKDQEFFKQPQNLFIFRRELFTAFFCEEWIIL